MEGILSFENKSYIKLDPRSKFILLFCAGTLSMNMETLLIEILFFLFTILLLINGKQSSYAKKMSLTFAVMLALDLVVASKMNTVLGTLLLAISKIFRMFLPTMMMFYLMIKTTKVSEFMEAFNKIRMTQSITISFSVMFRFFPTLLEEWGLIQNAMKFRGISLSFANIIRRPAEVFEYSIIPLLMSAVKIADELSAASLSRGLGSNVARTSITQVGFSFYDFIIVAISIGFLIVALIL